MSYRKTLLLLILHFAFCILHSQTLKVPYQYGFEAEDPEEANWVLNVGERGEFCNDNKGICRELS